MEKKHLKIFLVAFAIVICGVIWLFKNGTFEQQSVLTDTLTEQTDTEEETQIQTQKVYVHIMGAVKNPGVYIFDENPRVIEVVEKAGGFKKDAIQSGINQAELVEDGTQIVIESKKDKKKADSDKKQTADTTEQAAEDGRLDINTATKEELMTLTGIGEAKAMSIVSYREEHGKFKKIEDIMNISGIKNGVFEKIKNQIRV
jgi:competence protein ComEA